MSTKGKLYEYDMGLDVLNKALHKILNEARGDFPKSAFDPDDGFYCPEGGNWDLNVAAWFMKWFGKLKLVDIFKETEYEYKA